MPEEPIKQLFGQCEGKRIILIENNSQAQFGLLLRMQTGISIKETFLKYDGRPIWPEEIASYVEKKYELKIEKIQTDEEPGSDPEKKKKDLMDRLAQQMV